VKSGNAVYQENRALRVYDCCAAGRSLAGSTAATEPNAGFASGYKAWVSAPGGVASFEH
jgi:hypothetical protein